MATTDRVEGTLIGLCGQAGAGKDLVASHLRMRGFKRFGFADEVRREVKEAIDTNSFPKMPDLIFAYCLDLVDPWEKPCPEGTRAVLQWWGMMQRERDPEYWIKKLMAKPDPQEETWGNVVISDVRFQNEAEWLKRYGGQIWRVTRPGLPSNSHISEQEYLQIKPDKIIDNGGDLQYLAGQVIEALEC